MLSCFHSRENECFIYLQSFKVGSCCVAEATLKLVMMLFVLLPPPVLGLPVHTPIWHFLTDMCRHFCERIISIIICICQTYIRIHGSYPFPRTFSQLVQKSFMPRGSFKSIKIVIININNYEYLLLARNELSS